VLASTGALVPWLLNAPMPWLPGSRGQQVRSCPGVPVPGCLTAWCLRGGGACRGMRFSVSILSMTLQPGLVEPFYGTICLYHMEAGEGIGGLPFPAHTPQLARARGLHARPPTAAVFTLDAQSPTLCLLVQLEKAVQEDSAAAESSSYTRKEPVSGGLGRLTVPCPGGSIRVLTHVQCIGRRGVG